MFIDKCTTKTKDGKTYFRALIRDSYRENGKVKHRTIANISKCSPQEIQAIDLALKHKDRLVDLMLKEEDVNLIQGPSVGGVIALYQVARELGILKVLGPTEMAKIALWIVLARLIEPGSKLANVRLAQNHAAADVIGMDSFNEEDLYAALDWAASNQKSIEKRLFKYRDPGNSNTLYLYDITSSYLEGTKNEIAMWGYNRDKKIGKMQIVIGLLTDAEGWPVAIEVFQGNTQDPKTVVTQLKKLASRFGCKYITVVGDRGMIKSEQIEAINARNFHYITAITRAQIDTLRKQGVIQTELFTEEVMEVEHDGLRYILRKNPKRALEIRETRESKMEKIDELVIEKNRYLSEHPRASPEVAKKDVKKKIEKLKFSEYIGVIYRKRELIVEIDEERLAERVLLDGCYVLKTDIPKGEAAAQEVHGRYKDLSKVEDAFRTMKTVLLEIRPLYLRNKMRTQGHVFLVMLSYYISKHLREKWRDLDITVKEGVHELSCLCSTTVEVRDVRFNKIPQPRGMCAELLEALDVKLPHILPCRNVNVATRKKLNHKRKRK